MTQISVSEMQRNLHKLDDFDMLEIVDKKRNKVKGYFIDSKYVSYVEEIVEKLKQSKKDSKSAAGLLHKYANIGHLDQEEDAWKKAMIQKHSRG